MSYEAQQELAKYRQPGWWDVCRERAAGLPPAMAALAQPVIDAHDPAGWQTTLQQLRRGAQQFDEADPADRTRFFAAFFPRLGETLEGMWQAGRTRPYHRMFRAPKLPSASAAERMDQFSLLLALLAGLDPNPPFVAYFAVHLGADWTQARPFGNLLASALDAGGPDGDEVLSLLQAAAAGTDRIATWGRYAPRALLTAGRTDAWDLAEQLLLDTERDGDQRRSILEAGPDGHPQAFRRTLRLILDHGLDRSDSVAEALGAWLDLGWRADDVPQPGRVIERMLVLLDDPESRAAAIDHGPAEEAYLALWCLACTDAGEATEAAWPLLAAGQAERRYAAAHLLGQVKLPSATPGLRRALADGDLRVAERATAGLFHQPGAASEETFTAVENLLNRLGREAHALEPVGWRRSAATLEPADVAALLTVAATDEHYRRLLPYLPQMDPRTRADLARELGQAPLEGQRREAVLRLVADPAAAVRQEALAAAAGLELTPDEARDGEKLLRRKAPDLRRGVVTLLLNQPDQAVLASADHLLGGTEPQKLAGLEVLRRLAEAGRAASAARDRALRYAAQTEPRPEEQQQIDAISGGPAGPAGQAGQAAGLDAALGLVDPARRTPPAQPAVREVTLMTPTALAVLASLDELVHTRRDTRVTLPDGTETMLGDADRRFPHPFNAITGWRGSPDQLPLRDVWLEWNRSRPAQTRDEDGFELLRTVTYLSGGGEPEARGPADRPAIGHGRLVVTLLGWLLLLDCPPGAAGFALDAAETMMASIPPDLLRSEPDTPSPYRRRETLIARHCPYLAVARALTTVPRAYSQAQWRRLWSLERWVQEPLPQAPYSADRPHVEYVLRAHGAGAATDDDLIEHLLGSGSPDFGFLHTHTDLHQLSGWRGDGLAWMPPLHAGARDVLDRIRRRVTEVELQRGEAPTAASGAALSLSYTGGLDVVAGALGKLGRAPLYRGWSFDGRDARYMFSHLIRCSRPGPEDTGERFAEVIGPLRLGERKLVELAAFAPQWAGQVETLLGWPGLASGAWWMHAHTKDVSWKVDSDLREAWADEVTEHTPLSSTDLLDGAVDIWWFRDAYGQLGPDRWKVLDAAAKYCSTGSGHKRAQLFADAIRGQADEDGLLRRIAEGRHQDCVRALGLLPLPEGAGRDAAVARRYETIQEFRRSGRQFGPRRRASEQRAADIALANLARIAGYRDPLRLTWAMEARSAAGPGDPPPKPAELRRQAARVRDSLEAAMISGDVFSGYELRELAAHPVLAPRLGCLVITGGDQADDPAGYPAEDFGVLVGHDGTRHAVAPAAELRIAHPVDLRERGGLRPWQRDCVARRVIQPFKQVFREVYGPAGDEWSADASLRYEGREIDRGRGLALLGSRGWVSHPDREARKTFHAAQISVCLSFRHDGIDATDTLTVGEVRFSHRETWELIGVAEVPAGLFSEVMRDIDLAVSVADADFTERSASGSAIEMRASLAAETARLAGLANVRIEPPWILIDGEDGQHSVDLGRGVADGERGERGDDAFLPFADDDPVTAGILAAMLRLARGG